MFLTPLLGLSSSGCQDEGGARIFESVKGALASVKNDAIFAARLP